MAKFRKQRKNLNRHTDVGTRQLRASIERDGWIGAITVAADGETFDGSNRVEIGADALENAIVVESDGTKPVVVKRTDIPNTDDPRAVRLGFTANQIAAVDLEYDSDALRAVLANDPVAKAIADEDARLRELLKTEAQPETADVGELIDRAAELNKKWQVARGDLWEIPSKSVPGKAHRILCGDSTNADDVQKLMRDERAQLMNTDPPYGVDYANDERPNPGVAKPRVANDAMSNEETQAFLESAFVCAIKFALTKNAAWYLWHPMLLQGYFAAAAAAAAAAAVIIHRQIIWVKDNMLLTRGMYHWKHELCFMGWVQGNRPPDYGRGNCERDQVTVWETKSVSQKERKEFNHSTPKPVELFTIPMIKHLRPGEIAYEPFSGSAPQFVAGEQTGRLVYGLELEPKYVAVALERLAQLGLEPRRVASAQAE